MEGDLKLQADQALKQEQAASEREAREAAQAAAAEAERLHKEEALKSTQTEKPVESIVQRGIATRGRRGGRGTSLPGRASGVVSGVRGQRGIRSRVGMSGSGIGRGRAALTDST